MATRLELLGTIVAVSIGLGFLFWFLLRSRIIDAHEQAIKVQLLHDAVIALGQIVNRLQQQIQSTPPTPSVIAEVEPAPVVPPYLPITELLAAKHLNSEWRMMDGRKAIMHEDDDNDDELPYRFFIPESGKIVWTDANGWRDGIRIIMEEWVERPAILPENPKRGAPTSFSNNIILPELPDENPTNQE